MVTDRYSLYNGNGQLMTNEGNFDVKNQLRRILRKEELNVWKMIEEETWND